MFDKIQKNLLLTKPLLWNTKIIPVLAVSLLLHLIFFAIGFAEGTIDFENSVNYRWVYNSNTGGVIFFSVVLAILLVIIWLVYYFRNNAFKSFYPKDKHSLYKEWLLILFVCILNCTYSATYMYAEDFRKKLYINEDVFSERVNIISMASLFADGNYQLSDTYTELKNDKNIKIKRDSFYYYGKRYAIKSLLNKSIDDFTYQNRYTDSINQLTVKRWLRENKKDSVKWVMQEFLKIADSHNLKANITVQQWFDKVYNYPEFTDYAVIGRIKSYPYNSGVSPYLYRNNVHRNNVSPYYNDMAMEAHPEWDTINNTTKIIDNDLHIFPKYHVPLSQVYTSYGIISSAYTNPAVNYNSILTYLYFALSFSLLIFSFRVTSGRNWLITFVAMGIIAIITGVFSVIISLGFLYSFLWLCITIALLLYYYNNVYRSPSKDYSSIVLNSILWLLPWLLLLIYTIIIDTYRHISNYNSDNIFYIWLNSNSTMLMYANYIAVLLFMFFFTQTIRKWKGKPEA